MFSIRQMRATIKKGNGFDYIIIVSSTKEQSIFWKNRFEALKGQILPNNAKIISIEENWPGGAGQFLGTLYAFKKAKILKQKGKKIAIYHTSGMGKRMAPISLTEQAGKTAIKLPKLIKINGKKDFLRLLDAVVFSTQIYASTRENRLSVFWGDQIIIPEKDVKLEDHPIEIFAIKGKIPKTEKQWDKEFNNYGIFFSDGKTISEREKVSWEDFLELKAKWIAKSLGFFSISFDFLKFLLNEYKEDLDKKEKRMDMEPDLWIPLSTTKKEYVRTGGNARYWQRVQKIKKKFKEIQIKDLGEKTFWWDFGKVSLYQKYLLKTTENSLEGETLRDFFGLKKFWVLKSKSIKNSILINSRVQGKIENSIVISAKIKNIEVKDSVIFDSEAFQIKGEKMVVYNLQEPKSIYFKKYDVISDVFSSLGKIRLKTKTYRNGKDDWNHRVLENTVSFQSLTEYL